jgi:glycosyltransferase involved in cell wall biosynthesis
MRIAIVNRHLRDGAGGSELQCDLIARGLVARGHEVLHVVASEGEASLDGLPYACVRVGSDIGAAVDACLAWRPDVVYWRMNRLGLPRFVAACRRAGVPVVFASSSNDDVSRWPEESLPALHSGSLRDMLAELRSRLRHRASYPALRDVAALTVQREDFLGRVAVGEQIVIRSLIDDAFSPFFWPRPYVAWVASLKRRKRPELIPSIADRVAPLGLDVLVAGAIQTTDQQEMFVGGGRSGNLHHLGVLDQASVSGLLAGARFVVITSEEEGFSNVLVHSWWHGRPTLTLEHDPDGLVASQDIGASTRGDFESLLAAVARYASDDALAEAAGSRARALSRRLFDNDENIDALEVLLSDVARGAVAGR